MVDYPVVAILVVASFFKESILAPSGIWGPWMQRLGWLLKGLIIPTAVIHKITNPIIWPLKLHA